MLQKKEPKPKTLKAFIFTSVLVLIDGILYFFTSSHFLCIAAGIATIVALIFEIINYIDDYKDTKKTKLDT